jgi:hypothetical protein
VRRGSEQEWLDGMVLTYMNSGSNNVQLSSLSSRLSLGGDGDPEQWWTSDVMSFISSHAACVEPRGAVALLKLHPALQKGVVAQGPVTFGLDPTAVLLARMKKVRTCDFRSLVQLLKLGVECRIVQQFVRLTALKQRTVMQGSLRDARDVNAILMYRILSVQFGPDWKRRRV